ncbi:unnamed protein product, partial [Candidula unifasciata]
RKRSRTSSLTLEKLSDVFEKKSRKRSRTRSSHWSPGRHTGSSHWSPGKHTQGAHIRAQEGTHRKLTLEPRKAHTGSSHWGGIVTVSRSCFVFQCQVFYLGMCYVNTGIHGLGLSIYPSFALAV